MSVWWLVLSACLDYGFNKEVPPGPAPPAPSPACAPLPTDAFSVPIDPSCELPRVGEPLDAVIEWEAPDAGRVYFTVVVAQLTDDNADGRVDDGDMPDLVGTSTDAISVYSGDGAGLHWRQPLGGESSPAIGDLDGDGWPDVVVASWDEVYAFQGATGEILWKMQDDQLWRITVLGGIGIYDLQGDGFPEVVIGSFILDGQTGALRAVGEHGAGAGVSLSSGDQGAVGVAADIDADGDLDVVVGNAIYDSLGETIWYNGLSDGSVAVANFDEDAQGEIVVSRYPATVRLQDHDGTLLWERSLAALTHTIGAPTIADFDGDGQPEIGVAGTHVVVMLDTNGDTLWVHQGGFDESGFTGSSGFDFDADGAVEVVYADEENLWVFDGATGAVRLQFPHASATGSEYPVIADVDKDGRAEIVVGLSGLDGEPQGIRVIGGADGNWPSARGIWNQYGYAITNIDDDGSCPVAPASNWPEHNTFRAIESSASPANAALAVRSCLVACAEGTIDLVVHVVNDGTEPLPGSVSVLVFTERDGQRIPLATWATMAELPPGSATEGTRLRVETRDLARGLYVAVDENELGEGRIAECHEDDNVVEVAGADGCAP